MSRAGASLLRSLLCGVAAATAGCSANVDIGGIYFAPWIACVVGAVVPAYLLTRLCEARLFDYNPRYFAWTFLPLTFIFSVALWWTFARP